MTPEYWQSRYDSGETGWDKGAPSPALMEFLATRRIEGRVLVPGCGTGHDVRALAASGATVVGLDIARGAIERALATPRVAEEEYVRADFFNLPGALIGTFDWIFEHTCFCAIAPDRRQDYLAACLAALKPQGQLLAVFYLNPREPGKDAPPFPSTVRELDDLFGPHFKVAMEAVPKSAFPGREGREFLRHYLLCRNSAPATAS